MRRQIVFVLVLFVLFALAAPTLAQEVTPEVPVVPEVPAVPSADIVPYIFVIVVVLLVIAVVYLGRPLILAAAQNIPPAAVEAIIAAVYSGLDSAERYVEVTPTPVDDAAVKELRDEMNKLRDEIRALPRG